MDFCSVGFIAEKNVAQKKKCERNEENKDRSDAEYELKFERATDGSGKER